ncbi:zinc finger protein 513a [Denticeps clupeoides]|uniref:Zinc finger protein 513 n=1 Tax=Denticeps clupeoides TaxID=299321 RepID=A0AAY4AYK4_9TELE|nr:zinc finger protein 513 [Denticeps clupeoides]
MPRRKQQNPQPVKLDSEDDVGVEVPRNLTFETDFLLEQDLDFADPDNGSKSIGLDKFSADFGLSGYPLADEENSYSQLSMESDNEEQRAAESEREEAASAEPPFPTYLSCRGCGRLQDEPLGAGMDLVGPFCLQCCKAHEVGKGPTPGGFRSRDEGEARRRQDAAGEDASLKLHSCTLCGFSSRYANHVKRHMKTHNGEKPYRCPLCSYASAQLVNLQRHVRIHTGEKPYKCQNCAFACSSLGNLKRHQRLHATPSPSKSGAHTGSGPSLQRKPGSQKASDPSVASASDEAVGSEANLSLAVGDGAYLPDFHGLRPEQPRQQQVVSGLLQSGHSGSEAPALPPLLFPFTCRLCGVALEDEDGSSAQICAKCTLDMLTKDTSGSPGNHGPDRDKVYTCAICPFLTHYPNHLARHMKTHSGEKPYKCPQCDYASAHFDNLKRHHRVHTGEKPYKCHLCDYACGNLANLKRHQRVHSGAKPFQCAVCSYSCNQSMNLKRHMLRHTGEKPHKCQECGYTTGHWDNYKRHQKKHGLGTEGWVKVQLRDGEDEGEDEEEEEI